MIDTHCHLTFPDYAGRIDDVLARAHAAGVVGAISISTTSTDCRDALRVATEHDNVWCTSGVHPCHSDEGPHDWAAIRAVAQHPKCVAWGELGLDNHHPKPGRSVQDPVLAEQLAFIETCTADGIDLPVVIHCREAFDDLLPILRASTLDCSRYVFHCFTGTTDDARKVLDFGAMISFTGVVTYKNAKDVADSAQLVPDDRIMVETDAPFLSPEPVRGKRPCEPAFARHTAEFIAKLRKTPWNEFHAQIDANTHAFFGFDVPGRTP
ncbi:MAG: hypothetical protein DHS20C14_15110 [Phycisphaeraceae bacterium]|nr:MAG: hypothetical protein DHS20C14_15110 [Phycisphaeraceae bacterium]